MPLDTQPSQVSHWLLPRNKPIPHAGDPYSLVLTDTQADNLFVTMVDLPTDMATDNSGSVAALCDDGASFRTSCSKTLTGAILSTYRREDAGALNVGDASSELVSKGSYDFVGIRTGKGGSRELVVRRMKYTPNLGVPVVFSEPTEVYNHGYTYQFDAVHGRVMVTDEGQQLPLFMSTDKLGWLRWQPVTDLELVNKAIRHRNERICAMSGAPPTIFAMPTLCGECDDDAVVAARGSASP